MGLRKAGGCPRSPQPGAARTPPPPFTQRGPGTPLPASAAQPAQACGLHSRHCCRAGLWAAAPTGVVRPVIGERGARYPPDPHQPQTSSPCCRLPSSTPPPPPGCLHQRRSNPLTLQSAPARPPGRLCHTKAMATGRLLSYRRPSAAARRRERDGGRPAAAAAAAGTPGEPTSFFFSFTTPPPQYTPGRVSLTHWLRCPSSLRLGRITSGGESPTSSE